MPVAVSAKYPSDCPVCAGAGVLRWRQPCSDGVLRDMEHPCPHGCGQGWRHPAAENHQVIGAVTEDGDQEGRPCRRRGRADGANEVGGEFVATALAAWGFDAPE